MVQASQTQDAAESDEYRQTVEKLSRILEDRQGKYSFADIRVPLQSEEHGSLAAESVVVAYRYRVTALKTSHCVQLDPACLYCKAQHMHHGI